MKFCARSERSGERLEVECVRETAFLRAASLQPVGLTSGAMAQDVLKSRVLRGHQDSVMWLAFSPDDTMLASASRDQTIRVYRARTYEQLCILTGNEGRIESLRFSHDGKSLANGGGGGDTSVKLWDVSGIWRKPRRHEEKR